MKFVGSWNATEATLADGTPLIREQEYDLGPDEQRLPHNARLIAEGQLLAVHNTDKAREEAEDRLTGLRSPSTATIKPPPNIPHHEPGTGGNS
jgi:hypothetical protein